jgi:pimeloyl-ACP methyl ester carboxylesterase
MRESVALGDLNISFERRGAGLPFIWGHGLTSSMDLEGELLNFDWAAIESHTELVRYDARGHGTSTLTSNLDHYSWANLAQDQLAFADALGIDRFISGGASMGAATALHVAVSAPSQVLGLVLTIPPTGWETRQAQKAAYLDRAQLIANGEIDAVVAASRKVGPPEPFGSEWHERIERNTRAADHEQMAHVLRGAATADLPTRNQVATIMAPTLILAWSGDASHPLSSAEQLHQLIGPSQLVVASTASEFATWSERIATFVRSIC